jgi:hypothetical protein
VDEPVNDQRDRDRVRLWELIELLEQELSGPQPDWDRVRTAAGSFARRSSAPGSFWRSGAYRDRSRTLSQLHGYPSIGSDQFR